MGLLKKLKASSAKAKKRIGGFQAKGQAKRDQFVDKLKGAFKRKSA